jgi:sporulation protein YlmC with PRC-barrel domain
MGTVSKMNTRSIIGDKVMNYEGAELGELSDLLIDAYTGKIEFGIISYGGFLGVGEKLIAVPFEAMEMRENDSFFTLNVDKEVLEETTSQMDYQGTTYYIY